VDARTDEIVDLLRAQVFLLEEIAFNTSSKIVERPEYLRRVYASGIKGSTAVYGGLRTQPETHEGKVSVEKGSERVQLDPNRHPARAQSGSKR